MSADPIVVRLIQKGDAGVSGLAPLVSATPGQNAALVYYDSTQTYPANTVGAGIQAVKPAFQAADLTVVSAFQSADAALSSRIGAVEIGQSSSIVAFDTQANLYAYLTPGDKSVGYVMNDSTPAKNGTYRKVGATGTGSWVQSAYDRVAIVETKALGIGITFASLVGDGSTTAAYLQRNNSTDALTKSGGWEGTQTLYPTSRTNLLANSEDATLWTKGTGVTVTANAIAAPNGTVTADLVDLTSAAVGVGINPLTFGATPGVPLIHSIWLKGFSGGEQIWIYDGGTGVTLVIATLTPAWQKFTLAVTPSGSIAGPWVQKAAAGTNKFYIWGADSKSGVLSSYIKTTGSPASVTDYTLANNLVTLATAPATGETVQWGSFSGADAQALGNTITGATVKATPVDADSMGLSDSAAGNITKKLTWANLKAALEAHFVFNDGAGGVVGGPFRISDAQTNSVIGSGALGANTTGNNLAGLGYGVFVANTTGYTNVAIGTLAARNNTSGSGIVAVGTQALYSNTTAYYNTAVGDGCLWSVTTGQGNVAMGGYAGHDLTGSYNLFLGNRAGTYQAAVDNTLILDTYWRADAATELANALVVGNIGQATSQAQWLRINGDLQVKHRLQIQGKALTANGATTTFTYPASTTYQYITTSAASLATTLPATSVALDGLVITLVAGSAVATATWVAGSGGATIVGAPASLVANVPVRMIYHHATTQWLPY
jgi:hypothetical protein